MCILYTYICIYIIYIYIPKYDLLCLYNVVTSMYVFRIYHVGLDNQLCICLFTGKNYFIALSILQLLIVLCERLKPGVVGTHSANSLGVPALWYGFLFA